MRPTLRISMLTALFFTAYSGVVMASSTACQVAVVGQLRSVQGAMRRHVHHSAVTLARWKIGAAAWSKAHGGKVYAGVPAARKQEWTPLRFSCDDVALDLTRPDDGLLLPTEPLPELATYDSRMPPGLGLAPATRPLVPGDTWQQATADPFVPVPGGGVPASIGGGAPSGTVSPASFPPAPLPPTLAGTAPTPESPTIVLIGTGMLSFLVSKLRRRTVV